MSIVDDGRSSAHIDLHLKPRKCGGNAPDKGVIRHKPHVYDNDHNYSYLRDNMCPSFFPPIMVSMTTAHRCIHRVGLDGVSGNFEASQNMAWVHAYALMRDYHC
jgi:hypothetical protein